MTCNTCRPVPTARRGGLAGGTAQLGQRDRDPFGQDQLGSDRQGRVRILRQVAVPFWSSFLADARHLPHGRHQAGTATSTSTGPGTTSADITACFDEISPSALMGRVRRRVKDKRVLGLVKAFLQAGILAEDGSMQEATSGTPQGGILSPLLSNLALSVLDEHAARAWQAMGPQSQRHDRRQRGEATWRLVRYADDFVVMVAGTRAHAEALTDEVAAVLATVGLRLSEAKTSIRHIDEGVDFLGWRIQRHQQRGSQRRYVYTYPSKKALAAVKATVRTLTTTMRNQPLTVLLHRLNWVLRGWTTYFRHGSSSATFDYLRAFTWRRVVCWLRRKHPRISWKQLRRRYLPGWWPTQGAVQMFNPGAVRIVRYRYRGAKIPTPWTSGTQGSLACAH